MVLLFVCFTITSVLIAANGLNFVARCAGKKPATIPISVAKIIADTPKPDRYL